MRVLIIAVVLVIGGCRGAESDTATSFVESCMVSRALRDECTGDEPRDYETICEDDLGEYLDRWPDCADERAAIYTCEADLVCGWMTSNAECPEEHALWMRCLRQYD